MRRESPSSSAAASAAMMRSGTRRHGRSARWRPPHLPAQRGIDAAAAGIAQQPRYAGRAGKADLHRPGDAGSTQLAQPGKNASGENENWLNDVDAQAERRRSRFLVERGFQPAAAECADGLPDRRQCRSRRCRPRASCPSGSAQARRQKGPAISTSPPITSSRRTSASPRRPASKSCKSERGDRRAAIWTTGSSPASRSNAAPAISSAGLMVGPPRNKPACRRHDLGERGDLGRVRSRRLERKAVRKAGGDARYRAHSRRREITKDSS